jgi:hypothetical protein
MRPSMKMNSSCQFIAGKTKIRKGNKIYNELLSRYLISPLFIPRDYIKGIRKF